MTLRKIYKLDNGRIELFSIDYKTMSGLCYFGYLKNDHCLGYSAKYKTILKKINKVKK